AVALRGEPKSLQRLDIELQDDRVGRGDENHRHRIFEIGLVGVLEEQLVGRQLVSPEAAIGDVALELRWVRRALAFRLAILAAPAGERAGAGGSLMEHDVILVATWKARRALRVDKGG